MDTSAGEDVGDSRDLDRRVDTEADVPSRWPPGCHSCERRRGGAVRVSGEQSGDKTRML